MSDAPGGPDWFQASDGKWYPPQPAGAAPPPAAKKGRGCLHWIGLGVVVLIVIVIVAVIAGGGGEDDNNNGDDRQASIEDDVEVTSCGTDEANFMTADVRVTNNSSDRSNYVVEVAFETPDGGEQLDSAIATVNGLAAGQGTSQTAQSLTEAPGDFTCEVIDVTRFSDEG